MRSRVGRAAMGRGADSPAPRPRGPPPADGTCRYPPWSGSYRWAPSWPPLGVSACPPGETLLLSGTFSLESFTAPVTSACSQLFLGELSSRPRRARGSPRISHSPRSLIPITSRCLIDCTRRLVPPSAEVARVTTRRPPRIPRPLAPRPPRPSSLPPWPKRTTTRSGTASPTSESRCGAWEAWRCVPRLGPVGFSRNPRASGSIARRGEGASSPVRFRARSSPHSASSLSARYADRLLRRRHHLPRQEGEGREGGQEVTGPDANGQPARRAAKRHTTSRDEAGARLKLRARRRAVSARDPSAAIRDGR